MNVAELIAELQHYPPDKAVRVVLTEVFLADESGEGSMSLCDEDALEADEVRNAGPFVLIRSK